MAIIVVGGHSRNIGKTSVAAELIAAFPDRRWTAMKITQFGHGLCSIDGHSCHCAPETHPFEISEEQDRTGRTDTSRFLAAGAERAFWIRVRQGQLHSVLGHITEIVESHPFVMIESNSILRYIRPDLYIVVLRHNIEDWKESARSFLSKADAGVLVEDGALKPVWKAVRENALSEFPVFPTKPPRFAPAALIEFVRGRVIGPS